MGRNAETNTMESNEGDSMKSLKEKIEVMQAALDGKEIEYKNNGGKWYPCQIQAFDSWHCGDYRIKPEPMEFWVNVYPYECLNVCHNTKDMAEKMALGSCEKTIKVREVIQEEE